MTPTEELRHLLDENAELRGRLIHWELHECPGCKNVADLQEALDENAKLRELVDGLYHIHFGSEEESWDAWEDFCPCGICEERHGGEAPCADTVKDLADECCEPITKEIVIDRMRDLGIEVDG